eukprot:CAMPEP_0114120688 /NCGR_PEP_ID=MMETSP0043_2-20121206/6786_1 /TAXON_ID=464988 /ORGANISM="Hemiselmis andersenii, Strain CCMP644" /LENGTH=180 /DNA_ID=CAMNT_0001213335 /DNA_START=177 /DNA_END=716 /DNA_ORIENTATION=+
MLPSVKDARPREKSVRFGAGDEVEYDDEDQAVFDRHISGLGGVGRTPSQDPSRTPGRSSTGRASTRGSMKSGRARFVGDDDDPGWPGGTESNAFVPDDDDHQEASKPPPGRLGTSHRSPARQQKREEQSSTYNVGSANVRWQQVTEQPKPGGQAAEVLDRLLGKGNAAGFNAGAPSSSRN